MAADPLLVDVERFKGYAGLGDLAMLAWLAEGGRRAGRPLRFHRTRNLDLCHLVGLDTTPEPGGVSLDAAYAAELADLGRRPRLDYIRTALDLPVPLARPPLNVSEADRAWAAGEVAKLGGSPVLVFPQTAWIPREWPAAHWVDLAWMLHQAGRPTVVLLSDEDKRFTNTPLYWWGTSFVRLAALMERAAAVVGNDSFPAHLAAAVGVPTFVVLGPTRPTVFAHAANVTCLVSATVPCTGCHFGPPFRAACDQGCQSLFGVPPAAVAEQVLGSTAPPPAG